MHAHGVLEYRNDAKHFRSDHRQRIEVPAETPFSHALRGCSGIFRDPIKVDPFRHALQPHFATPYASGDRRLRTEDSSDQYVVEIDGKQRGKK